MGYLRSTVTAVALAVGLLAAAAASATDVSMANGSVNFSTPDSWLGIMQTDGDPEVRVFQVPDPSPTGQTPGGQSLSGHGLDPLGAGI